MSCKQFPSTVGAVFEAQIKSSKSTGSHRNLKPIRERRMKKTKVERKSTQIDSAQLEKLVSYP